MKKKREKIVIAYLKDYSLEQLYENHVTCFCDGKAKPLKAILLPKYQYMLHLIITRCKMTDKNCCYLNAQFFRDRIFYAHFTDMLYNLSYMNIVHLGKYVKGEHSTEIRLQNWNIAYMTSYNLKYIKWAKIVDNRKWEVKQVETTPFTTQYMESLTCLRLVRKDDALLRINSEIKDKQSHKYHYHRSTVEDFNENNLRIYKIDEQGRIYHALTSLPHLLREFFNIKYELDISNSHPLLLNHYLIKHYSIPNNILREAKALYHYDGEQLCKLLKHNNLNVPLDVLEYIYKTQHGCFYDDFVREFGDIERSEVKKKVFGQVFYSHVTDKYVSKFCKAFMIKYPNVYKVIRSMKVKTDDKLPHLMMYVESMLFQRILKECWSRGYKAVNLHDALVIFDVEANKHVTIDELTAIVEQVYNRFGLFPTVKAEIGG